MKMMPTTEAILLAPPSPLPVAASASSPGGSSSVVDLLAAKKRSLLSEIGSLLTLRERLVEEVGACEREGVPFEYESRFAASPATLKALETIARDFREELRAEREQKAQQARREARAERISSPAPAVMPSSSSVAALSTRPATAPAASDSEATRAAPPHILPDPLYSTIPNIDTPNLTPIHTPSRMRATVRTTAATEAPVASAAAAISTTAAVAAQPTGVKRIIFPDSHGLSSVARPFTAPHASVAPLASSHIEHAWSPRPASFIHHEESIHLDAPLANDDEDDMASHYSHYERSYTVDAATAARARAATQRLRQANSTPSQHPQPYIRPSSAIPSPASHLPPSSATSSTASSPATANGAAAPLGYLARKSAQLRQAEQEALQCFRGHSLGVVAADGCATERQTMRNKAHYQNFAETRHEGNSTFISPTRAATHPHPHPHPHGRALQNITNTSQPTSTRLTAKTPGRDTSHNASHTSPAVPRIHWG